MSDHEKDSKPILDVQELSIAEIVSGLKRLKISSAAWIISIVAALLLAAWKSGAYFAIRSAEPNGNELQVGGAEPPLDSAFRSGVIFVRESVSNEQLNDFIRRAHSNVRIIVPWFVDPISMNEALTPILANRQASVLIYFLDPISPYLVERGKIANPKESNFGPTQMRSSLLVLGPSFAKSEALARVFTYSSIPPAFVAQADDQALIGFHMHSGTALRNPNLIIQMTRNGKPTPMGKMIDDEFEALSKISREVELSSIENNKSGIVDFSYK